MKSPSSIEELATTSCPDETPPRGLSCLLLGFFIGYWFSIAHMAWLVYTNE